MSEIAMEAARLMDMLPDDDKTFAYEFIKKLVMAWDPDFTKTTPDEAERIAQAVGDHGVFPCIAGGDEKIVDRLEGRAAVKIVGIDHRKGAADEIARAEHRVPCPPWLLAALRHGESGRKRLERLMRVFDRDTFADAVADDGAKIRFQFRLDDENDAAKTGAQRIENGKVNDDVAGVVHGRDLLESAKTAAHSRRHDDQLGCYHV